MNNGKEVNNYGGEDMLQRSFNNKVIIISVFVIIIFGFSFFINTKSNGRLSPASNPSQVTVDNLPEIIITDTGIELVLILAGEFTMGCISGDCPDYIDRKAHHVIIREPFYLGKYPVTQRQWYEVMRNNPSLSMHDPDSPVDNVSWTEAQEFIKRINEKERTNKYRLPTEAEWEYAARAGTQSKYFWGDDPLEAYQYAWYEDNSNDRTHPVGTKLPNSWNLYDISGNVEEWVQDWYDYGYYENSPTISPGGPEKIVDFRVLRGGSWRVGIEALQIDKRFSDSPDFEHGRLRRPGFRLAASALNDAQNGIEMVYVEGGTFIMGCTPEQENECRDNEKPAHEVTLSDYYIGKYEITQAQWKEIMGKDNNPSLFKMDDHPVVMVKWNDIQDFIKRLNEKTDRNYRLPTEAEWEYAARGGNQSRGYKYSGSNNVGEIAWYFNNSENTTHPVGTKSGNELGIYDMSGNAEEWVDWIGDYSHNPQVNPQSTVSGQSPLSRGGGISGAAGLRVSFRNDASTPPNFFGRYLGFRLAHSSESSDATADGENLAR